MRDSAMHGDIRNALPGTPYLRRMAVRLNKYISEKGICSRREADRFIEQGRVMVNGKKAQVGTMVSPGDVVRVNGRTLDALEEPEAVYLAFHKPVGITCTTEAGVRDNIVDYVNYSSRIFPVGRLDKDSQGLILLTNQGDAVNKILRAGNKHEKEYVVTVDKPITDEFISGMSSGVPILGVMTKKCRVVRESPHVFTITLVQGLNRQIRRMCEYFGYEVVKLERTRIMHIRLKGLPPGEWRELTPEELSELQRLIARSSGEASPGRAAEERKTGRPTPANAAKKPKNTGRTGPHAPAGRNRAGSKKRTPGGNRQTGPAGRKKRR
jgi:23S rRNA pseudouridine2604 synthase